jgi:sugar lactone lactonase YvrE
MTGPIYDPRVCLLGEGPLWHPERKQLFWFDILGKKLLSQDSNGALEWRFDEHVSAAGWVDRDTLLIASETALFLFDLITERRSDLVALEADDPATRSNDGRADPWGGFWIGTMGKTAEPGAGTIYRYYKGRLEPVARDITISNAICFSPDRHHAYFGDTHRHHILRQRLGREGWPEGRAEVFIDLREEGLNPDGAVVDAEGCLWNAQWGAARVARYAPDGRFLSAIRFPASQVSCPAFGGHDLQTLFVTSATQGLTDTGAHDGATFVAYPGVTGQPEHRVIVGGG